MHHCTMCGHLPHPDRRCRVKRVDGPAVDSKESIAKADYEHIGRDVTQCACDTYTPELNGAA
ncbi:hypothetical protein [Mycolicibacterium brisbanense]